MEKDPPPKLLSISDLLRYHHPISATFSLQSHSPTPNPNPSSSSNPQVLVSLSSPSTLIGTLSLPLPSPSSPHSSFFQFSDDSSSICCDVLEFHPNLINNKIRVLSWNFIPFKNSNTCAAAGILEIIKWEFLSDGFIIPENNSIRLGEGGEDNSKARQHSVSGVLDSVSPVSLVSCGGNEADVKRSFIVEILSCDCQLCVGKKHYEVKGGEHRYVRSNFVYFSGGIVTWHSAFKKMVGRFVGLSGLKKKSVHLGKGEALGLGQLMFVSTNATCLHSHKLGNGNFGVKSKIMGRGELGLYVGVIKGVYMQGAIVELDDDVMLLVTDQSIVVPHSLRVGAVLSARNVHVVNPKFRWRRMLVLGTCCKTNINISSFSPLASGCQLTLQYKSRLGRFISSLAFAVRLWALLMVQCLRKKFSGPFSEKEILGSKHSQGMVETYLRSVLASSSLVHSRDSIFIEFCKHESHGTCSTGSCGNLCLAVPFSMFMDNCDRMFVKSILQMHNGLGILEDCDPLNPFLKVNSFVNQPMRRIFSSKEIGVSLIGNLKMSRATGRLQYIDATGSIDVVIPDFPSAWDTNATYEVFEYSLVLEGRPELSGQAHIRGDDLFSCRCITSSIRSRKQTGLEVFVHCFWRNVVRRELLIHHGPTSEENFAMLDPGTFHLLHLTHIFPSQSKFHGDLLLSSKGFSFAEATAVPWNLNITVSNVAAVTDSSSLHELQQSCENGFTFKKCKRELASGGVKKVEDEEQRKRSNSRSYNMLSLPHKTRAVCAASGTSPVRIPCTVTVGRLHGDIRALSTNLCSTQYAKDFDLRNLTSLKKVLLEFDSENFFKYKLLHIGGYYIVKHDGKKCFCDSSDVSGSKVVISSGRQLNRCSFHFDEDALKPGICHLESLHLPCFIEGSSRLHTPSELLLHPSSIIDDDLYSDISVHVTKSATNFLNLELPKQDVVISAMLSRDVCNAGVNLSSALSFSQNQESCLRTILPQGSLMSLQGVVLCLHSGCCAFDGVLHDVHKLRFAHVAENLICLHIVTESRKVLIDGCLGKNDYPVGLGPGADVTFHRILPIGGHDRFMLTPVTYITVNSVIDTLSPDMYSFHSLPEEIIAHCSFASLIQLEPCHLRRFGCRVVAIHIVKLKRRNSILSDNLALKSMAYVELAGFIVDDGSSQRCCWANGERAAMLLRLHEQHEQLPHLGFKSSRWRKDTGSGKARNTLSIFLENVLRRHESITVKNFGASYETSGQDLQLSGCSDYTFCTEDEILLKIIILNACASMSWSVIGHVMDLNATKVLEKYLLKEHMKMPDLLNVWAREVSPVDDLVEARSLYQDL